MIAQPMKRESILLASFLWECALGWQYGKTTDMMNDGQESWQDTTPSLKSFPWTTELLFSVLQNNRKHLSQKYLVPHCIFPTTITSSELVYGLNERKEKFYSQSSQPGGTVPAQCVPRPHRLCLVQFNGEQGVGWTILPRKHRVAERV